VAAVLAAFHPVVTIGAGGDPCRGSDDGVQRGGVAVPTAASRKGGKPPLLRCQ